MLSNPRLRLPAVIVAAGCIAALAQLARASESVKVVSSFSILTDLVERVGGEHVDVVTIVGHDSDAHVYEPKPDDVKAVAAAQLVVVNGLGFEGWLDRLVDSSGYKGPLVTASNGVNVEKTEAGQDHGHVHSHGRGHDHDHDHGHGHDHSHSHGDYDPHAWQNAANAEIYVSNIASALCAVAEAKCPVFTANAKAYRKELAALHAEIKSAMARIPEARRTVITSHDAFGYFSAAYGVTFLAPEGVSTESEASAKDVARLIRQIREDKASAIFVENITDPRLIEQISRETGLKGGGALYSDALSGPDGPASSYIKMMQNNARLLAEAMTASRGGT
ncbi:MAG: metal ABC transporter solute-binding protein, Zn/Mn family [Aestuariivirga sp.]|uniref:metal ABC transporter solute-binding protein, Zn/Mn family n=1 Tax=Aestuariivirga sp. TaxID=2650926 RepID=UPI0038CFD376